MATLERALACSQYASAAAQALELGPDVAMFVEADGHDGGHTVEVIDGATGEYRAPAQHGVSLEAAAQLTGQREWWPVRDGGEWGEQAERDRSRYDGAPLELQVTLCEGDEYAPPSDDTPAPHDHSGVEYYAWVIAHPDCAGCGTHVGTRWYDIGYTDDVTAPLCDTCAADQDRVALVYQDF